MDGFYSIRLEISMTKSFDAALERLNQNDPKLIRLSIFYVAEIGEQGIKKLSEALKANSYLRELKLVGSDSISTGSCQYLAQALKNNYTLLECAGVADANIPFYLDRNKKIAACIISLSQLQDQEMLLASGELIDECLTQLNMLIPELDTLPQNSYPKYIHRLLTFLSPKNHVDLATQASALRILSPLIKAVANDHWVVTTLTNTSFHTDQLQSLTTHDEHDYSSGNLNGSTIQNKKDLEQLIEKNPIIQAHYSFSEDNAPQNTLNHVTTSVKLEELIHNFISALSSRSPKILKSMWEHNAPLSAWFCNKELTLGTQPSGQPILRRLSLKKLIEYFPLFLSSRCPDITKTIWDSNPLLRAWFCGQELVGYTAPMDESTLPPLTFENILHNFRHALSSQNTYIINALWNGNDSLRAWLQGEEVNFSTLPDEQTGSQSIGLESIDTYFKFVLSSHHSTLIMTIWNKNTLLQPWFRGQEVNFEKQPSMPPKTRSIGDLELLFNFKATLASLCCNFILAMWENNERLYSIIKNLLTISSKELLKKVLSSSKAGRSSFIDKYLTWLNDKNLIQSTRDELAKEVKNKRVSKYKQNQLNSLDKYLKPSIVEDLNSSDAEAEISEVDTPPVLPQGTSSSSKQNHALSFFNNKKRSREEESEEQPNTAIKRRRNNNNF